MAKEGINQADIVNEAKGNPGRHKKKPPVVDPSTAKHGAPKELSQEALQIWNLLAPDLRALNFLRDTDLMAFARYCEHAAKWWQLTQKLILMGGDTYVTDSLHGKMERLRPDFIVRERVERRLEALEDRFGMNPQYRQQILMRMAGLTPLVPGDLFNETQSTDDSPTPNSEAKLPSAIGLLRKNNHAVN